MILFTLLAARPVAVLISLVRTRTDLPTRLFMGWFGPRGIGTVVHVHRSRARAAGQGDLLRAVPDSQPRRRHRLAQRGPAVPAGSGQLVEVVERLAFPQAMPESRNRIE